jgi:methylenetetrahydrofolate reductase (NADPH)
VAATTRTVAELLAEGTRSYSFEFMPPRTDAGEQALWNAIRELEGLAPTFVSVTYGAGGGTRDRTVRTTARIAAETTMTPVGHLTAVAHSVDELRHVIGQYADAGVGTVLALRGDPPGDPTAPWERHPEGLEHAAELVELVRASGSFSVGVAAFPEKHPRSPDRATDVRHFLTKVRAGADFAITQMFFSVDDYLRLRDDLAAAGSAVPVLPGLMPLTAYGQVAKFVDIFGVAFPQPLLRQLEAHAADPAAVREIGIAHAVAMSQELLAAGSPGLHFYTLNRSSAAREVFTALGLDRRLSP